MIRQRNRFTAAIYLISDLVATLIAFLAAWELRFGAGILPITKDVPDFNRYLFLLLIVLPLLPIVFYFHGLYQTPRSRGRVDEGLTVFVAVILGTVLLSGVISWWRPALVPGSLEYYTFSRGFLALFAILELICVFTGRLGLRGLLRRGLLSGLNLRRILVVGAGALGKEITQKLLGHEELGLRVVGFLDDDPGKMDGSFFGVPVLGRLEDLARTIEEHKIDQVFLALPLEAHKKMLRLLRSVGDECVDVKLVPDILQYATIRASLEDLDGTPVINLSQVPMQGWNSLVKRTLDVTLSGIALTALLPFLPVLGFLIWREDKGPLFYRQERMGLDGKCFQILKLRSMRVNAEATTGPVWAIKGDQRRTRTGSFLRRWSLDELPQLWNVLKGEMSLIGPRPERPAFVHEFKGRIPQYMLRHRVKAGITGWAQVHGWRGDTSIKKRIQYDLYYIQNWSLALDMRILWMTLRHRVWRSAY